MPRRKKKQAQRSVQELLRNIHERHGFYLVDRTLTSLRDFLVGFSVGRHFVKCDLESLPCGDFSWWLSAHLNIPTGSGGWYYGLKQKWGDERGFDQIFKLLYAFWDRKLARQIQIPLSTAQRCEYQKRHSSRSPLKLRISQYQGETCAFVHARYPGAPGWNRFLIVDSVAAAKRYIRKMFPTTLRRFPQ